MGDLITDGATFSCPFCASKIKLQVSSSKSNSDSKKLANTGNFSLPPPPGGQCTVVPSAPTPCTPSVQSVDPGQTRVKVDGKIALNSGCKMMCSKGGLLTASSPTSGKRVAKDQITSEKDKEMVSSNPNPKRVGGVRIKLDPILDPIKGPYQRSRPRHNREANKKIIEEMERSPQFAERMKELGIVLKRGPRGGIPSKSPAGWTWHHGQGPGKMYLIKKEVHVGGKTGLRKTLHPINPATGRRGGGYEIWGI